MTRTRICLALSGLLALTIGCDLRPRPQQVATDSAMIVEDSDPFEPAPKELPKPPLELPVPKDLPATLNGVDLSKEDSNDLEILSQRASSRSDYKTALAAQFWSVKNGGEDASLYNLACYYARNELYDEAFYWLQRAALKEGVDARHASRDEDLETLRRDTRYPQIAQFLRQSAAYWRGSDLKNTLIYLPKKFDATKPTPVIVTLHGRGGRPANFFGDSSQVLADQLGIPFICISGTQPTGPKSFVWAGDLKADAKRVNAALQEAEGKMKIAPGGVIAVGFSEGAQIGLELAVRDPERFAGAICMSPGAGFQLSAASRSSLLKERRFVVTIGGNEHPGNVALARKDRDWLRSAGAEVEHISFPGIGHTMPHDFYERFPKWVSFILLNKKG